MPEVSANKSSEPGETKSTTDPVTPERKVIKKGDLHFETSSNQETRAFITKQVLELKGYISDDDFYKYDNRTEYRITLRVPSNQFDQLLNRLTSHAKKINRSNINTSDVTDEFVDIEARLKTKKELENRYRELLKEANSVDDMLAIERELGTLRADIESVEGRLRLLDNLVSYSTLSVSFYEKHNAALGFGLRLGEALETGWSGLLWLIVAITSLWPFILSAVILVFVYRRLINNISRK
jgi:hypothetical protein